MLSDAIASLGAATYTVYRTAQGAFVDGVYAVGAVTTFDIQANIQDTSGEKLENPPEAQYASSLKVIFTTTELRTRTLTNEPDKISIDSKIYEIFQVDHWDFFGSEHYRAYAYGDTSAGETEDLADIMQTNTMQSWLHPITVEGDEFTLTIPKAMIDDEYIAKVWIVDWPDDSPEPDVRVVLDGTETITTFKIKSTALLLVGTVLNCFTRDRA